VRLKVTVMPGGHVMVALSGELDIATAPAARDLLAELTSAAVAGVTVHVGGLTFVDAAGLRSLAEYRYPVAFQAGERGLSPGGREHDRLTWARSDHPAKKQRFASRPGNG